MTSHRDSLTDAIKLGESLCRKKRVGIAKDELFKVDWVALVHLRGVGSDESQRHGYMNSQISGKGIRCGGYNNSHRHQPTPGKVSQIALRRWLCGVTLCLLSERDHARSFPHLYGGTEYSPFSTWPESSWKVSPSTMHAGRQ